MYPLSNTAREKSALESGTYQISVSSPLSLLHTGIAEGLRGCTSTGQLRRGAALTNANRQLLAHQ